ncbi:hypothetical protein Tco_1256041 [Tanacetum coccineum]
MTNLTVDDQEKSKGREESDSTIPDPSHQTVTSTPPVIAPFSPFHKCLSSKPLITGFNREILCVAWPRVCQESEKSLKEIIKAKKEQGEEKQDSTLLNQSLQLDQTMGLGQQGEGDMILPLLALTSTGWQITDTREAGVDSSMHRSDPESEHSEQSSDDISLPGLKGMTQLWRTWTTLTFQGVTSTWFKLDSRARDAKPEPGIVHSLRRRLILVLLSNGSARTNRKEEALPSDLEGPAFYLVNGLSKNKSFFKYQMVMKAIKLLTNQG